MHNLSSATLVILAMIAGLLGGCEKLSPFISDAVWNARHDLDQDGIPHPDDCDDLDPKVGIRVWYSDVDQDGHGAGAKIIACDIPSGTTNTNDDCDDSRASVHPNAKKICDGLDNDCDGQTDEGVELVWFEDHDQDGFGNKSIVKFACEKPDGSVSDSTDCDDTNANAHPGGTEVCDNGLDDDCNGQTDDVEKTVWHKDMDKDGFGDPNQPVPACTQPTETVLNDTDCDDTKKSVHPGAVEICNLIDDNCNGQTDEDVKLVWHHDVDKDGYGLASDTTEACAAPNGFVSDQTDCDDTKSSSHPNAPEICDNNIDDDCNGKTDDALGAVLWYLDADKDGFGTITKTKLACVQPIDHVENSKDCDDTNPLVNPLAIEICGDFIDNNCNGIMDIDAAIMT